MYILYPPIKTNWSRFCWYEKAFTKEECEKIIELGKQLKTDQAVISIDKTLNKDIRDSKVSWIKWNQDANWIFEKLSAHAQDCNNARYNLDLTGYTEELQYTEYDSHGHYDWHQDFGNNKFSIRKLSQIILLSDPSEYEGGNLKFFNNKEDFPNTQGTLICFPSFEMHKVEPVISGNRKSLVAWISGPPFK